MTDYYHSNILPWTFVPEEDRVFRRVIQVALVFYLVIVIAASVITVPKLERSAAQPLPPQLAKLILEREKPKPKPPEIKEEKKPEQKKEADKPKPEEKKKPEKKVEEKKPEPVKEDVPPPPPKVDIEAARKKAAKSGLLALSDDLADMREAPTVNLSNSVGVTKNAVLTKESTTAPQLLTQTRGSSGGVDTRALTSGIASRRIGSGGDLQARATEQVDSPVEAQAKLEAKSPNKANRVLPRSEQEIDLIMQRYKGAITQMYQRARREDPTLKGTVVFEITIEPSGAVSACKVLSSEMNAPDLLGKVVARIKTINFGAKDVPTMTISYPFVFVPVD